MVHLPQDFRELGFTYLRNSEEVLEESLELTLGYSGGVHVRVVEPELIHDLVHCVAYVPFVADFPRATLIWLLFELHFQCAQFCFLGFSHENSGGSVWKYV